MIAIIIYYPYHSYHSYHSYYSNSSFRLRAVTTPPLWPPGLVYVVSSCTCGAPCWRERKKPVCCICFTPVCVFRLLAGDLEQSHTGCICCFYTCDVPSWENVTEDTLSWKGSSATTVCVPDEDQVTDNSGCLSLSHFSPKTPEGILSLWVTFVNVTFPVA